MSSPSSPPLTVEESDGTNSNRPVTDLKFNAADFTISESGRSSTVSLSGSGSGASLTSTQIGFGDVSNLLSGSANFVFTQGSNQQLEINQASTAGLSTLAFKEAGTTAGIFQYRGSTNGTLPNSIRMGTNVAGGNIAFMTGSATTRMYIDSVGEVGIGTTSPSAPLHVKASTVSSFLLLENVDTGNSSAPDLVLYRNSTSPAVADFIGIIDFKGKDDGGNEKYYGRIGARIRDASAGSEDGQLFFMPAKSGSTDVANAALKLDAQDGAVFNEGGQADLDFRVESDTNTHAFFVDAGNDTVGIGGIGASDVALHVFDDGGQDVLVRLETDENSADKSPALEFYKNSAADISDYIMAIDSYGLDDASNKSEYSRIATYIEDETAATENGVMIFQVAEAGSLRSNFVLGSTLVTVNGGSRNVDFRVLADDGSKNIYSDAGINAVGIQDQPTTGLADNNPALQVNGSMTSKCAIVTKTSATVDLSTRDSNELIGQLYVLTSASAKTFTVPTSCTQGDWFRVCTTGANGMDIVSTGGATLNGSTPTTLTRDSQNEIYTVVAIATDKWICTTG